MSSSRRCIELDPRPKVAMLELDGDTYRLVGEVKAGSLLAVGEPYAISFDPAWLTDLA
jgi:hypothetical protein